jgi:hypothetical protein
MECEFLSTCGFMERANRFEPFIVKMIIMSYCEKNKFACARYKLSNLLEEKEIPDDLWPG